MARLRGWDKVVVAAAVLAVGVSLVTLAAVVRGQVQVATVVVLLAAAGALAGLTWAWPRLQRRQGPGRS